MSYFKKAPSIEKMKSDWTNETDLNIMKEKFGVGVTAEHRQEQSLLDLFYCRRAGFILGITEWGMFALGSWTQIILHFWSCLKLDTWSHLWSKAAAFCCCFGLQERERLHAALSPLHGYTHSAFMAIFSHQQKVLPNIAWAWELSEVLLTLPWVVCASSYTTAGCC